MKPLTDARAGRAKAASYRRPMRQGPSWRATSLVVSLLAAGLAPCLAAPAASRVALPIVGGKKALASVEGQPVTLDEFERQLASLHAEARETARPIHRPRPAELLERLITARLIVQEGERMGLDELPEVVKALDARRRDELRNLLFKQRLAGVTAPDPGAVEALYRGSVEEFEVLSLLFPGEQDAKAFVARVRAGGSFETLAREAALSGKAKGGDQARPIKRRELLPGFEKAITALKTGSTSAALKTEGGFAVVKLVRSRLVDDAAARKQAEADALKQKRLAAIERYTGELKAKWAKIDRKTLDAIDFEAKEPGFDALRGDRRAIAEVAGEDPVRVADVARAIEAKFFHGIAQAIASKKLNKEKHQMLDDLLVKKVVVKEALRLKLDQTPEYARAYAEFRDSLLFGMFVQKVVDPSLKVSKDELEAFLGSHVAEYTTPEMMRIDALAFRARADGEASVAKLRKGADVEWMRAHAEGQAPASEPGLLRFDGAPILVSEMPPGLAKAVAGASSGEVRFYEDPGKASYALVVREVIASRPQPFEAVKGDLAKRIGLEKQKKSVEDWAAKLRAASKVEIFADGPALDRLLDERLRGR